MKSSVSAASRPARRMAANASGPCRGTGFLVPSLSRISCTCIGLGLGMATPHGSGQPEAGRVAPLASPCQTGRRRAAQACAGRTSGLSTSPAPGSRPRRTATMFSLARAAMAWSDAALMPATCGVSTTCSSRRSGPSGRGSTSNTSSPAPPSRPASMRRHQRRLVDQAAAGGVDQDGAGLHQPEPAGVDQMAGLGRQWRVQRDEVGLAQQVVEIDQTVAEPGHGVGLGDRVGDQDLHVEAKAALGDGAADAAEPDHAHRGLVQPAVQQRAPSCRCACAGRTPRSGGPQPPSAPGHGRRPRRGWCRRPWRRRPRAE